MIEESKVLSAVRSLEKEVENMQYITKTSVLRAIAKMKIDLEQPERFDIPEFLRRD